MFYVIMPYQIKQLLFNIFFFGPHILFKNKNQCTRSSWDIKYEKCSQYCNLLFIHPWIHQFIQFICRIIYVLDLFIDYWLKMIHQQSDNQSKK